MNSCPSCHRHLIRSEVVCPFCGNATGLSSNTAADALIRKVGTTLIAVVTPLVLAACYGTSFKMDTDSALPDSDGDGFDTLLDCDDANAEINPNATEICDDTLDNDCDGASDADDTDCAQ